MTSTSKIWKELTSILSNLNNFHSLEVVDRVSETQLQMGENSNWIIWRLKGQPVLTFSKERTCWECRWAWSWFCDSFVLLSSSSQLRRSRNFSIWAFRSDIVDKCCKRFASSSPSPAELKTKNNLTFQKAIQVFIEILKWIKSIVSNCCHHLCYWIVIIEKKELRLLRSWCYVHTLMRK